MSGVAARALVVTEASEVALVDVSMTQWLNLLIATNVGHVGCLEMKCEIEGRNTSS